SFRDVKARIAATTNQAVQSSTKAAFSATDVVVTTAVVTLTDVVTLSAEAVPTVVSFFDADAAARQDLLNKLRGSTVSAVCSTYYVLTDTEFCSEMIRLHQLGKSVHFFLNDTHTSELRQR
ncbi:hypothetical protein JG687_00003370, partial [Phytophthora cactorum]